MRHCELRVCYPRELETTYMHLYIYYPQRRPRRLLNSVHESQALPFLSDLLHEYPLDPLLLETEQALKQPLRSARGLRALAEREREPPRALRSRAGQQRRVILRHETKTTRRPTFSLSKKRVHRHASRRDPAASFAPSFIVVRRRRSRSSRSSRIQQRDGHARRIMAILHPRRSRRVLFMSLQHKIAFVHEHARPEPNIATVIAIERLDERLDRRPTRPQHAQRAISTETIHDRALEPNGARGPIVEEKREASRAAQIAHDVRRARRTRLARRVRAGRREGRARFRDERASDGVRGHAHRHGRMPRRDDRRHARRVRGEEEGERARPERAHERFVGSRGRVGGREEGGEHRAGGHVYDQRVVGRSALGGKDFRGCGRVEGEGTQAIDGLCWESDDVVFCQELNGSFDGVLCLWI